MGRKLGAGLAGGLLAGALVGAVEAIVAWANAHGAGDVPAIAWATVVYGLIGAAGGVGAGVVAAVLGTDAFALALAGVGAGLGFIVARFRIIRDVFLEQLPPGPLTLVVQVVALTAVAAAAVAVWRALRGAEARRTLPSRPVVAMALVAFVALAAAMGSGFVTAPPAACRSSATGWKIRAIPTFLPSPIS